jgi:UDP-2,3-diacylglucosamine pyrophosphatase LpxH
MNPHFSASSKMLFLSDVHLGAFSDERNERLERELIQLVNFAEQKGYRIVILGDFFDYWMEYPSYVPPLGQNILHRFEAFNRSVAPVLYITGNHDNWTLGHFSDLGFDVEPNYRILSINNQRLLLIHGDATGPEPGKLKRPLSHRLIRNRLFLKIYRGLLPPEAGLYVMKMYSKMNRLWDKTDPGKLDHQANVTLKDSAVDCLFCGHDHLPRVSNYPYGTYINTGAFCFHHSLAEYNNKTCNLVRWDSNLKELLPFQSQALAHE